jgi:hypothetical protein
LEVTLAVLLYPGLALTLALALLSGWLFEGRAFFAQVRPARFWRSIDGLAAAVSLALAALGLALLPWPSHPAAGWAWVGHPAAIWAALEGAFLLPALPGLLAPLPLAARAASREAQMSLAGRCVVWLALGAALWGGAGWAPADLPGRLLLGLAGLLALPAAIGAGPFGAERSLSAAAAEEGLDEATAGLVRFARTARGAALLAALVVASAPPALGRSPVGTFQVQPWIALMLVAALFLVVILLIRQISAVMPRLTLPAALRWCWLRSLPLAAVGLVYLVII